MLQFTEISERRSPGRGRRRAFGRRSSDSRLRGCVWGTALVALGLTVGCNALTSLDEIEVADIEDDAADTSLVDIADSSLDTSPDATADVVADATPDTTPDTAADSVADAADTGQPDVGACPPMAALASQPTWLVIEGDRPMLDVDVVAGGGATWVPSLSMVPDWLSPVVSMSDATTARIESVNPVAWNAFPNQATMLLTLSHATIAGCEISTEITIDVVNALGEIVVANMPDDISAATWSPSHNRYYMLSGASETLHTLDPMTGAVETVAITFPAAIENLIHDMVAVSPDHVLFADRRLSDPQRVYRVALPGAQVANDTGDLAIRAGNTHVVLGAPDIGFIIAGGSGGLYHWPHSMSQPTNHGGVFNPNMAVVSASGASLIFAPEESAPNTLYRVIPTSLSWGGELGCNVNGAILGASHDGERATYLYESSGPANVVLESLTIDINAAECKDRRNQAIGPVGDNPGLIDVQGGQAILTSDYVALQDQLTLSLYDLTDDTQADAQVGNDVTVVLDAAPHQLVASPGFALVVTEGGTPVLIAR